MKRGKHQFRWFSTFIVILALILPFALSACGVDNSHNHNDDASVEPQSNSEAETPNDNDDAELISKLIGTWKLTDDDAYLRIKQDGVLICGFGNKVKILEPEIAEQFTAFLDKIRSLY